MIGELKSARRAAGWSQRTLAERIGVDAQTIKRLENGVGSVSTFVAVMTALDFRLTGLGPGEALPVQLKARRHRLSLSLDQAASRTGMSRTTIAGLERGGGSVASLLRLLTIIAPKARRRAPERSYWGEGDKDDRDSRFTPPDFMANIYAAFGEIDLDPCAHVLSPVVARRRIVRSEGGDGLVEDWSGRLAHVADPLWRLADGLRLVPRAGPSLPASEQSSDHQSSPGLSPGRTIRGCFDRWPMLIRSARAGSRTRPVTSLAIPFGNSSGSKGGSIRASKVVKRVENSAQPALGSPASNTKTRRPSIESAIARESRPPRSV